MKKDDLLNKSAKILNDLRTTLDEKSEIIEFNMAISKNIITYTVGIQNK